jgi:hypothetical protein
MNGTFKSFEQSPEVNVSIINITDIDFNRNETLRLLDLTSTNSLYFQILLNLSFFIMGLLAFFLMNRLWIVKDKEESGKGFCQWIL